jgi:hypothetical protein
MTRTRLDDSRNNQFIKTESSSSVISKTENLWYSLLNFTFKLNKYSPAHRNKQHHPFEESVQFQHNLPHIHHHQYRE